MGQAAGGAEIKVAVATYGAGGRPEPKTDLVSKTNPQPKPRRQPEWKAPPAASERGHLHPFPSPTAAPQSQYG